MVLMSGRAHDDGYVYKTTPGECQEYGSTFSQSTAGANLRLTAARRL